MVCRHRPKAAQKDSCLCCTLMKSSQDYCVNRAETYDVVKLISNTVYVTAGNLRRCAINTIFCSNVRNRLLLYLHLRATVSCLYEMINRTFSFVQIETGEVVLISYRDPVKFQKILYVVDGAYVTLVIYRILTNPKSSVEVKVKS